MAVEFWHLPAPSQTLVTPHPLVTPPQRVSVLFAVIGAQVPLPLMLHAWQAPQLELPQQTPSTQLPVLHWLPAVQATPLAFSVQLLVLPLPWQVLGDRQSVSAVQGELLHAFVPQT